MIGRDPKIKKWVNYLSRIGGYERLLVYFVIRRGNCFSILEPHLSKQRATICQQKMMHYVYQKP